MKEERKREEVGGARNKTIFLRESVMLVGGERDRVRVGVFLAPAGRER